MKSTTLYRMFATFILSVTILSLGFSQQASAEVVVTFSDAEGELTILGNNEVNAVEIVVGSYFGADVIGINTYPGVHTFEKSAVTKVTAQMGRGPDVVLIRVSESLLADFSIDTGHGEDYVGIEGLPSLYRPGLGSIAINTGNNSDDVVIGGVDVLGDVDISTGNFGDGIYLSNEFFVEYEANTNIFGNLYINSGGGDDNVSLGRGLYSTAVYEDFMLELGQGNDALQASQDYPVLVGGFAYLSGGQGTDTCLEDAIMAEEIFKVGFED